MLPFWGIRSLLQIHSRKEISCAIEICYLIGSCSKNTQKTILKRYNEADPFGDTPRAYP